MICGILERFSDNSRKDGLSVQRGEKKLGESVCVCMYVYLHIHMLVSRHFIVVVRVVQARDISLDRKFLK